MIFRTIQCIWMFMMLFFLWDIAATLHIDLHEIKWNSKEIARDARYMEEENRDFHKKFFEPVEPRKTK